jgi:hypothetical protein
MSIVADVLYIPYCLRYIQPSLMNAHTSPMAQYTLVSIRGKNSMLAVLVLISGRTVTKNWSKANPAM